MHKRVFKKIFLVLMIISLLLSVFNVGKILAAEPTFKLSDAKIESKSNGVEASIESFTNNKLITDTTFHKINDYVKYRLTIKNTSNTKYKLVLVDDNNSNDNVTYEYDYNKDEEILPDDSVDVVLTITYKEGIQEINQRTQDQEVKISFIVEDEDGNTYEEDITNNPKTSDNILIYVISAIVSLLMILAIVFRKKISKLFVLLVLIIPMITYAVTPSLIIVLKNNTKLFDKMVVYTNVNGVNETVLVDYDTPYERPDDPIVPGYSFANWYAGGSVYNFDEPLIDDVSITAEFNIITYNIDYDLDGGSVSGNPTTYDVETETFTLKNPTKDGYTFVGWTGSNGSEPQTTVTIEKGSTEDKSYAAHFVANGNTQYTVRHKYKRLDGSFDVETEYLEGTTDAVVKPAIRHKYGFVDPNLKEITITADGNAYVEYEYIREQYVLTLENTEDINTTFTSGSYDYETEITLTAKDKDHYDFIKWSNDETSNPLVFNITENITLSPIYQIKQYTVSFDEQGGSSVNDITKDYNSEIGDLPETTKEGYLFDGWYTNSTGGTKITADTLITSNITYYAHWTKSLALATISPESITLTRGQETTITVTNVEEEYEFISGNSSIVTVDTNGNVSSLVKGNTTITVRGIRSEIEKTINVTVNPIMYTINYDAQGGSAVQAQEKEENTKLGTLPNTTRDGYLFDGWFTSTTGGEKISEQTDVTGTTTYYAHWTKSLALATITPESITLTRGQGTTITVTNVEEGYEFISGNSSIVTVDTNGNVSSLAKGNTTITVRGIRSEIEKTINVTVNPIMYTINYDAQGGSSVDSVDKEENTKLGTLPSTTKDDYVFDGWYTNGTGGTKIDENTLATGTTTYYAHWLKSMSLATVTPASITMEKNETANITVTNVEEEYTFTSNDEEIATVDSNGVVTGVAAGTTTITIEGVSSHATKTVEITVNPMMCTVTFNSQGGESIASKTIEENNEVGTLPIPEKDGYTFTGWYIDTNWTTRIYADTVVTDNVTYYARYIEDEIDKVFFIPGSCTFNGNKNLSQVGNITSSVSKGCVSTVNPSGSNINYTNVKYIDTHISLFSSDNFEKDFELGFTIDDYVADNTVHSQATIVNSKLENAEENYPGFVVRRKDSGTGIELTEKFGSSTPYAKVFTYKPGTQIRVARIGGKMYYSQDGANWTLLQNINSYLGRFNLTTWFGAYSDETDMSKTGSTSNPDRYFKGTLSNIYIKMANTATYIVTFDAHGGTPSFSSKNVMNGYAVGQLPTVERDGYIFTGWFTEENGGTQIDENTIINGIVTFHAHYIEAHTVTFDGNGGTPSFATKEVGHGQAVGELPTGIYDGFILDGWFTDNSWTTQVSESTVINNNETFIAKWRLANVVAMIGDEEYGSLEAAVDAVPTNGTKTTIKVLQDITLADKITIPSTKNIELDLQSYTIDISANLMFENNGTLHIKNGTLLSNAPEQIPNTSPVAHGVVVSNKRNATLNITGGFLHSTLTNVIENAGTITMTNGRLEANSNSAAINNNQYGVLNISGGQIIATGTTKGQAIYNDKGTTTISGDVYIENTSQSSSGSGRAAVHNNQGTITIKGGTIVSKKNSAVKNNATMIIGDNSNPLDITTPSFQGDIYGLEHVSGKTTTVYDGIFKGKTAGISLPDEVTHNADVEFNTSGMDGNYHTAYLEQN